MAPLFSAVIAIACFHEPLRWPLVAGTLLVVAGGVVLACEGERPADFRIHGAVLAVAVAVAFGLRDNLARLAGGGADASAPAQAAAVMLGAAVVLLANLLRQDAVRPRLRAAVIPFGMAGIVTAVAQVSLLAALARGDVTVVAPLVGTGVLWTVVFAALFLRSSELVERRLLVVALLVVAGSALVGATG
jgi:drug/metabolite transporter (DMT)-like permease